MSCGSLHKVLSDVNGNARFSVNRFLSDFFPLSISAVYAPIDVKLFLRRSPSAEPVCFTFHISFRVSAV